MTLEIAYLIFYDSDRSKLDEMIVKHKGKKRAYKRIFWKFYRRMNYKRFWNNYENNIKQVIEILGKEK